LFVSKLIRGEMRSGRDFPVTTYYYAAVFSDSDASKRIKQIIAQRPAKITGAPIHSFSERIGYAP